MSKLKQSERKDWSLKKYMEWILKTAAFKK